MGIETIEISGVHRDYVSIQYQNGDRILEGFAYSKDDENQEAFEQDFPYIETDDQLRSIEEIKKDMESNRPMDRLLVGDVGFGKTEVAMRAAFKAVNDHKQVAVLVPTTVLAQQHYANFKERFESFAVEVAVLSRFQSKAEQKETLEKLKKGRVDIIIGTHRLLSKDVVFSDLGLIVIDEEQRFGVKHKETLKELKKKNLLLLTDDVIYEDIVHEFYTDANRQMKGFKAEYFKNKTLSGQPEVIRTESSVDYDWGYGAPLDGFPTDGFSVRWTACYMRQAYYRRLGKSFIL